jgi:hypothetical protein
MNSNFAKVALVVAALAAAVVLFVVLGGDDDSDDTTQAAETTSVAEDDGQGSEGDKDKPAGGGGEAEKVPRITIVGGQPQGGVQELEFTTGEEVRFEVVSDIAEHVHVHGYDVIQDVEPGKPVVFAFPADTDGVFEVELEDSATPIAELTINPG